VVSDALSRRLDLLRRTHTIQVEDLARDADVDEQLVALIRDATRIALGATADSRAKVDLRRGVALRRGEHASNGEPDEAWTMPGDLLVEGGRHLRAALVREPPQPCLLVESSTRLRQAT